MDNLIYIADDNKFHSFVLQLRLSELLDRTVKVFNNAEDCLKAMANCPSLVILDYYMNGYDPDKMNGIDALKKIKKTNPDVPVIMLSGITNVSVKEQASKYGALAFLNKDEGNFQKIVNLIRQHNI